MGVRENRSKSDEDSSAMLPSNSLDVHLFPTKNGPGPGQPKYSDRESRTLTSLGDVSFCDHDHREAFSYFSVFPRATNSFAREQTIDGQFNRVIFLFVVFVQHGRSIFLVINRGGFGGANFLLKEGSFRVSFSWGIV